MGCCFSTATRGKRHPQPRNDRRNPPPEPSADDRAPPPSVEQECVKEVLSETPFPNLRPEPQTQKTPEEKIEAAEEKIEKIEEAVVEVSSRSHEVSEMCSVSEVSQSQVSEMCSVSESFSTATTFTEKRDDEVASKPTAERATRSPAKVPRKRVYSGELAGARVRRAEPSPEKKGQAAARSRLRQQSGGYGGVRLDHGEGSGRRSRSPATRGAGGAGRVGAGKSPVKQTGRAGGKLQNVGDVQSQSKSKSKKEEAQNGTVEQKIENESLENPHVSLECFIFL